MLRTLLQKSPALSYSLEVFERRLDWFVDNASPSKLANLALAGASYALKMDRVRHWPVAMKIDLSPLCNLRCTVCVHARPSETSSDELKEQVFEQSQMMTVDQFRRIVDEVKGKTAALSLYYLGDPFVHPDLEEMCSIAAAAGINTKVSSNFSFQFSDERIRAIVESGMTHLTACVDGLTQESYAKTRVGGRIDKVTDNLERLLRMRKELGRTFPKIEVQFIKFQHNAHEVEAARERFVGMGADQFTEFWGDLGNCADQDSTRYEVVGPRKNRRLPQCHWPHFSMTIKYNGDVIPCCTYRQGTQYTADASAARAVGNVFATSVWDVWTSKEYDRLRRLVSSPERARREGALVHTFCEGCTAVYETTGEKRFDGSNTRWEDMYAMDERGRVMRKPETEVHTGSTQKRRLKIVESPPTA